MLNLSEVLQEINVLKSNDKNVAAEKLKNYITKYPESIWLKYELVKLYALMGDVDNARKICKDLYKSDYKNISIWALYYKFNYKDIEYEQDLNEMLVSFVDQRIPIDQEWKARLFAQISITSASEYVLIDRHYLDGLKKFDIDCNFLLDIIIFNYEIKSNFKKITQKISYWTIFVSDSDSIMHVEEEILYVNLNRLNISNLNYFDSFIMGCMCGFFSLNFKSISFLNDYGIKSFSSKKLQFTNHRYLFFKLHSHILLYSNIKKVNKKLNVINIQPRQLYVRIGNVELHAISSYLNNPNHADSILESIIPYLLKSKIDIVEFRNKNWWPRNDFLESLASLMTNAGWYSKRGSSVDAFKLFIKEYLNGCESGYLINTCLPEFQILSPYLKIFPEKIVSWSTADFFKKINNKNILFLTPFADQINDSYKTGKLYNLYKEYGLDINFNLKCIPAEITTFPNGDDDSWSTTYQKMKEDVDQEIYLNSEIDMFIASCGCYGIPMTSYANKKFSLTAIYYGHIANFYFGIMTKAFTNYRLNNKIVTNYNNWTEGNLGKKYANIELIDSGRYI